MIANAASALGGLVQTRPCWPPTPAVPAFSQTGVEDSPLPTTGNWFLGLVTGGREIFSKMAKLPSPRVTSVPNPLYVLPQDGHMHRLLTGAAVPPHRRSSLAETLCFKEPPKRAGPRLFWNSGLHVAALRKQPGLPSMNQITLCCVHTGWATLLPISKAQGLGAALHTWASGVGNQSCSK